MIAERFPVARVSSQLTVVALVGDAIGQRLEGRLELDAGPHHAENLGPGRAPAALEPAKQRALRKHAFEVFEPSVARQAVKAEGAGRVLLETLGVG
ncbi:hypothetical protein D3C78_1223610 [compost metagenome]